MVARTRRTEPGGYGNERPKAAARFRSRLAATPSARLHFALVRATPISWYIHIGALLRLPQSVKSLRTREKNFPFCARGLGLDPRPSCSAWPFLGTNLGPPLTFRASVYLILERLLRECAARVFFTYLLHPVPDRTRPRLQIANQPKPRQSTFASIHSRFPMALSTDSLPDSVERRRDGPQYRARRTPNLRTRVLQSQAHQPDARSPGPLWRALDRTRTAPTDHTVILEVKDSRTLGIITIKWEGAFDFHRLRDLPFTSAIRTANAVTYDIQRLLRARSLSFSHSPLPQRCDA